MANFRFDPEEHRYYLDGVEMPGTTKILTAAGIIDYSHLDEWYRDKGKAVHLACELWDLGTLDEDTVDPEIQGRLAAWKKFRVDTGFVLEGIEIPLYHPVYRYGCIPDRWGMLNGKMTLIEIKPATQEKWHVIQRSANREVLCATGTPIVQDINVYLNDNGTYKLSSKSSGRHEREEFLTLLSSLRIKEKYV